MYNKKCFSMVELVIGVALIGIIGAVVYVSFTNIKKSTSETDVIANINLVENTERSIYIKNGRFLPASDLKLSEELTIGVEYSTNSNEIVLEIGDDGSLILAVSDGVDKCYYKIIPDMLTSKVTKSGNFSTSDSSCSFNSVNSINS